MNSGVADQLRIGLDSAADLSDLRDHPQRYGVVLLQPWNLEALESIKLNNPDCMVICHKNLGGALNTQPTAGVYSSGLPYSVARQWALGPTMYGYSNLFAMDVGNGGYQSAWAQAVATELTSAGWDGVFMDNADIVPAFDPSSTKYDKSSYPIAMEACLSFVGHLLNDAGVITIPNIGGWGGNPTVGRSWLKYVDGAMHEQFVKWGTAAETGYVDPGRWRSDLDSLCEAERQGRFFLAVTHSASADRKAARYGWATTLLGAGGHAAYCFANNYGTQPWLADYRLKLGKPAGDCEAAANGIVRRRFELATVLVNPTSSTVTYDGKLIGPQSGQIRKGAA